MSKKPLIILTGPTAVGKTSLSVELAKAVKGEIVSADSMQVYKCMDIGTAKISPEEMGDVPHHLISAIEPDEDFSVVKYQKYAKMHIQNIHERNKIPILVGGTGFYIQSVLYDIDFEESNSDTSYRNQLQEMAETKGSDYLHELLTKVDKVSSEAIHPNNTKRIIRALEYMKQTGEPISIHNEHQRKKESPYNYKYFVLNKDREKLYNSINNRVDIMIDKGLVDEVKQLLDLGYDKNLVSMQGLGYKEIIQYLDGECSIQEAIDILKRDTRHYAKRQLTWFRRERDVVWVNKDDYSDNEVAIIDQLLIKLTESGIIKSKTT